MKAQRQILEKIILSIKGLETDPDGFIKQSISNRKILQKAANAFDSYVKESGYKKAIEKFIGVVPKVDAINEAFFLGLSEGFKPNAQYVSNLRNQLIADLESYLLNDGFESQIKKPLLDILNQNVNTSARFTDMLSQIQQYIVGNKDLDGRMLSYAKQITTDAIFNYSRSYQQAIASDLGLEWYLYSGGLTKEGKYSGGSRDFCIARADKYFHHSEIEKWASADWTGKRRGTNASSIFTFAGGYNCRHSLIPVSSDVVPDSVKSRIQLNN